MKTSFSFFKNKVLTYLAIALCVVTIPLHAEEDYESDEESSKKFKWPNPVKEAVKLGYAAYEYIPIMRGPILMASAPLFGTCLALLVTEGDSFKRKFWAVPCFSTLITGFVFGYGVGQTLTLGNLNN